MLLSAQETRLVSGAGGTMCSEERNMEVNIFATQQPWPTTMGRSKVNAWTGLGILKKLTVHSMATRSTRSV